MKVMPARTRSASALAAPALPFAAGAVLGPSAASATEISSSDLAPGAHAVSANVYMVAADTPIGQNAYVTNSGRPPLNPPTSPVTGTSTDRAVSGTDTTTSAWATTWGGLTSWDLHLVVDFDSAA